MKFIFYILLFSLLGYSESFRKLSEQENDNLQSICGTKPHRTPNAPINDFSQLNEKRSIFGGIAITGDIAPWAVRVKGGKSMCSGVIISSRHVLTASHCFIENETVFDPLIENSARKCENRDMLLFQDHQLFEVYGSNGQLLSANIVKMVLFNMCYKTDFYYDDLMLLEVQNDIPFTDFAFPACIAKNRSFETPNNNAYITGFGHNSSVFNNSDETGSFELRYGYMKYEGPYENEHFFTTHDEKKTVVARTGDSGCGAFSTSENKYYVFGIYSAGWLSTQVFSSIFVSVGYHYNVICNYSGVC